MKEFMLLLAEEAGKIAMKYLDTAKTVSYKADDSIVTNADKEITQALVSRILERYPEHSIITEEIDDIKGKGSFEWIIDPIDGTLNYAKNNPLFAVSIALREGGVLTYAAVYMPYMKDMFYAQDGQGAFLNGRKIHVSDVKLKDAVINIGLGPQAVHGKARMIFDNAYDKVLRIKDYGSTAVELAYVASGRLDGMIRSNQSPWDYAGGELLVLEAGGKVHKRLVGEKVDIVASNPAIFRSLVEVSA